MLNPAEPNAGAKRGRPRSEQSHAAVLRAAAELLREVGLRSMTTDEIAARSGASKATIHRWWPNKYAVAVEAFLTEMMPEPRDPQTGSPAKDLRIVLRGLARFYTGPTGQVVGQLIGEAQFDSAAGAELHKHLMLAHRDQIKTVWARGVAAGQFRSDLDPDDAIDVLIGPLFYRYLLGREPLRDNAAALLVEAAMTGLSWAG